MRCCTLLPLQGCAFSQLTIARRSRRFRREAAQNLPQGREHDGASLGIHSFPHRRQQEIRLLGNPLLHAASRGGQKDTPRPAVVGVCLAANQALPLQQPQNGR